MILWENVSSEWPVFNVWLKACYQPIETFIFLVQYIIRIFQLIKKQAFLSAVL